MALVAIEFSGEHPDLPRAEAGALLRSLGLRHRLLSAGAHGLYEVEDGVPWNLLARRLAYARQVLEVAASGSLQDLEAAAAEVPVEGSTFALRGPREAVVALGRILEGRGLRVSLDGPDSTLRVFEQEGRLHLARERAAVDRSAYGARRPALRPFFRPGVVLPRFARALVNLAGVPPNGTLLDPFCGTGSFLVEGALCGLRAVGLDAQLTMVVGARRNLRHFGLAAEVVWGDARRLSFRDGSVDGVVADPPYGRSSRVVGEGPSPLTQPRLTSEREGRGTRGGLYRGALGEVARVLRPGGRAVFLSAEPRLPEAPGLVEEERHRVPVHKSLVRHVAVFRKKG